MTPYYEQDGITIYHGDCREVLPGLSGDVLVTDPPYGMNWRSGRNGIRGTAEVTGDQDLACRSWVLCYWGTSPALVFGTWKVARPAGLKALLIWDKGDHVGSGDLSIPWKPNTEEIYVLGAGFCGRRESAVLSFNAPSPNFVSRHHPTEKPIALMRSLLVKCPAGIILDPFMGSGTTLRAAKDLGRQAIGIEIEERYCEIAAKRLSQRVFDFQGADESWRY